MMRPAYLAHIVISLAAVGTAHAWPGHNWEDWRRVTTWTLPEQLASEQAGRQELFPLLALGGEIDSIKSWESRRARIAATVSAILGEPSNLQVPAVEVQSIGQEVLPDHVRRHVRIRSEGDDWIPAYILVPKLGEATSAQGAKRPVMICLHQTSAQGKDEPAGIKGDTNLSLGLQLVRRGYICVVPDAIGFGERIPAGTMPYHDSGGFYKRHPKWSFMGKMVWDVSRIVDYLETLPEVDATRIGCIGHSHGAYGAIFAAAFDTRIAATIASSGFNTFRADPTPDRWSHLTALIPQIGVYLPEVSRVPFDWHEVCALLAPRPLYVWYSVNDRIFPNTLGLAAVFEDVRRVYGLYGAADDLTWQPFAGPHSFPPEGRALAYNWLDDRLMPELDCTTYAQPATTIDAWDRRRETIRSLIRRSIGSAPQLRTPLAVRLISEDSLPDYQRKLIEYSVAPDERVRAYLCVPHHRAKQDSPPGGPRRPAVLVLHQTVPQGKREPVGLEGAATMAMAAELAERGYVTLAPDSITAGDRIDKFGAFDTRGHYLRCPGLSAMGKMLHDAQRAIDVLEASADVDAERIGAIGHSLGAEEAVLLAAFDQRVRACVASCGYATLAAESNRLCWARDEWFSYMPKLRPLLSRGKLPGWDWDDVIRLIAPRAFFQYTAENDQIFPESRSAHQAALAAGDAWSLYNASERFTARLGAGRHDFPDEQRREAYRWLDRQLRRTPADD